jgi:hypothetical protein
MFYRIRNRAHYLKFSMQTSHLSDTRPLPCHPDAPCDVHTMLCKADMQMYLIAIKSLLRFGGSLAVTAHSDGTLDSADIALLQTHIPGIRLVLPEQADAFATKRLGADSFLWKWRNHDASYRRVIDTELWSRAPRRIIMDSDILVLGWPPVLSEWIARGGPPLLLGQPQPLAAPALDQSAPSNEFIQTVFMRRLPQLSLPDGSPAVFLNGTTSGFYACQDELSLEAISEALQRALDAGIPMKDWGGEQCLVIYLLSNAGARRLPRDECFNFTPAETPRLDRAHIVHFFGTHRFHKGLYPSLARAVIRSLQQA